MKKLFISVCLFLTGCTTYQVNLTQSPKAPSATIQGFYESGFSSYKVSQVQTLDGKEIGRPNPLSSNGQEIITVPPGSHELIIVNNFNLGLTSLPRQSMAEIQADLKANEKYSIKFEIVGNHTHTWLVDQQGNRISDVVSTPYEIHMGSPY